MNQEPAPARSRVRHSHEGKRKRRTTLWVTIIVLVVVVAVTGKFSYHRLKTWRAEHFAAQAGQLTAESKWNDAAQKYRAALQLDPLNYDALRGAGQLAARLGRPEASDLWEQVIRLPQATVQDREDYADLLVKLGRLKVAQPILEPLLKGDPDARTLSMASTFALKSGDRAKAMEFSRLAAKRAPNDEKILFQRAELLAASPEPDERSEARKILWQLAGGNGETRPAAIEALAKAPDLSADEKARVLPLLDSGAATKITASLLAADLRIELHPEQAEQIYDQTVARWNNSGTNDLTTLARWLNTHQQPERVLSLFSLEQAFKDNQLLLTRLDALGIQQRWNDIDDILTHPELTLDPSVLESFRGRTAQEKGAAMEAEVHWTHAISLATGDPYKLRFVAYFAEESHATGIALKAYDQLAKFPDQADFAFRSTQRLSAAPGDINVQRAAAEKISARTPDDPNASAQLTYVNLLGGINVDENAATAKSLVEKYPDRLSYRVTAALAYLRQHDPVSALSLFKPTGAPPVDWSKTPPAWRAIYAATLRANEQEQAARDLIATIPKDKLTAEERSLIE